MASPRIRIGLFGAALAAGAVALLLIFHPRLGPLHLAVAELRGRAADEASHPNSGRALALAVAERSQLADGLNSPSGNVHADLRLLNAVFLAYREALRTGNPVGENAEITAVLKGRNRLGFAFIPVDCPAINGKGELCDRWGTPYFFHQLSGEQMEIRSAGPDRKLWTGDDQVLTP